MRKVSFALLIIFSMMSSWAQVPSKAPSETKPPMVKLHVDYKGNMTTADGKKVDRRLFPETTFDPEGKKPLLPGQARKRPAAMYIRPELLEKNSLDNPKSDQVAKLKEYIKAEKAVTRSLAKKDHRHHRGEKKSLAKNSNPKKQSAKTNEAKPAVDNTSALQSENKTLRSDNATLQSQVEKLTEQNKTLSEQLKKLEADKKQAEEKLKESPGYVSVYAAWFGVGVVLFTLLLIGLVLLLRKRGSSYRPIKQRDSLLKTKWVVPQWLRHPFKAYKARNAAKATEGSLFGPAGTKYPEQEQSIDVGSADTKPTNGVSIPEQSDTMSDEDNEVQTHISPRTAGKAPRRSTTVKTATK